MRAETTSPRWGARIPIPGFRLAITALVAGALLTSTLDVFANAYPDADLPPAPLCENVAPATVVIDGGTVTNTTTLDLSADGGTGIGDSSGGDDNLATSGEDDDRDRNRNRNKKDRNRNDRAENEETAAAGNGGVSDAGADGGAIAVENVNSGGNVGNAIAVGDTVGSGGGYGCDPAYESGSSPAAGGVYITGGTVTNETIIEVSADGGTAIADASGGDGNITSTGGRAGNGGTITSSAGNGGVSTASADGGVISLGDINSGGNAGNAISVGDTVAGPVPICCAPPPIKPVPVKPVPAPGKPPGKVVIVTALPSTGEGSRNAGSSAVAAALVAFAAGAASLAMRRRMS
jgi:hypothetical protein